MLNKSEATGTNQFDFKAIKRNSPCYQDTVTTKSPLYVIVSTLRPSVPATYGVCGHVSRSTEHTCGSPFCIDQYGW